MLEYQSSPVSIIRQVPFGEPMHTCENRDSYLFVEITDPLMITAAIFQDIAQACRSQDLNKILIDLRAVRTTLSIFDRYKAGIYVASIIGPRIKMAVVAQAALITRVAETVAVNRYGKLKMFSDIEEARRWLEVGT